MSVVRVKYLCVFSFCLFSSDSFYLIYFSCHIYSWKILFSTEIFYKNIKSHLNIQIKKHLIMRCLSYFIFSFCFLISFILNSHKSSRLLNLTEGDDTLQLSASTYTKISQTLLVVDVIIVAVLNLKVQLLISGIFVSVVNAVWRKIFNLIIWWGFIRSMLL